MKFPCAVALSAFLATYAAVAAAVEYKLDAGAGVRTDSLRWNIAGDANGTNPNILSELTWTDLRVLQLRLGWQLQARNGFHIRASGGYGWIQSGRNQDSDYLGDDRTQEFSRSNNDTDGDNVADITAALGYRIGFGTKVFALTPMHGRSRHDQNLRITNGRQTIPNLGPFSRLNSTYQTEWTSSWRGAEMEWKIAPQAHAFFRYERHYGGDYYAAANWNLRNDFAHPKSFEHRATGKGKTLAFGGYGPLGRRWAGWAVNFAVEYNRWKMDPGTDQVFFSNGTTSITRLNEVAWKSWSITSGAEYRF